MASAPKSNRLTSPRAVGKRIGGALYIHKEALGLLAEEADKVEKAESMAPAVCWNIAKIEKSTVSLLQYEPFEIDFPALLTSTRVDLLSGTVTQTDYKKRANPPILHRKELLLAPDDPRLPKFRALTSAAEDHGLFVEVNKIGTRAAWSAKIAAAGLTLRGGRLLRDEEEHHVVARHKTAIVRHDLSKPMQLMMRVGLVTPQRSLFDYGCGQGEDVQALVSQGFDAFGWDPHHAATGVRKPADVVNLGFVLNVIEDPRERVETLKAAWGFATQALCVSVMISWPRPDGEPKAARGRLSHIAWHFPAVLHATRLARTRYLRDGPGNFVARARHYCGFQGQRPRTRGPAPAEIAYPRRRHIAATATPRTYGCRSPRSSGAAGANARRVA